MSDKKSVSIELDDLETPVVSLHPAFGGAQAVVAAAAGARYVIPYVNRTTPGTSPTRPRTSSWPRWGPTRWWATATSKTPRPTPR